MSDSPTETTPTASSPETRKSSSAGRAFGPDYDGWRDEQLPKTEGLLAEIDRVLAEQRTITGSPYTDAVITGTPGFISDWPAGTYCGELNTELASVTSLRPPTFTEQLVEAVEHNVPLPEFEDDVFDTLFANAQVLLTKHRDYGPLNISLSPGGPLNGLRVRMHDKLARINHLLDNGVAPEHESLRDSFLDLANYAVIAQLVIDGVWPE